MKTRRSLAAGLVALALITGVRAEQKDEKPDYAKLLPGVWEVTRAEEGAPLSVGDTAQFGKDRTAKTTRKKDSKELVSEGSYALNKDKIVVAFKTERGIALNVLTIKKITDKELVIAHEEGNKVIEFKRKE
jgi:uncharacterized protein (TIGR03066 family)